MNALVLEGKRDLRIRDIEIAERMGPDDVEIAINTVGICGSDLHYYEYGGIGEFMVKSPMVLGHEASGTVVEVGANVSSLRVGDRVCMEPGIPDSQSRAVKRGLYNLDPAVRFWATPPVHGCLRPTVVHPAAFTYRLPASVSFAEGAVIEPLAVGVHAANKAKIANGQVAAVIGAGTIGIVTALSALSGGCSKVVIVDVIQEKLEFCRRYTNVVIVNPQTDDLREVVRRETENWGVDCVFEASGSPDGLKTAFEIACPGGCVIQIGCPPLPVSFTVSVPQVKELRLEFVHRYAHVFPNAIQMVSSGRIDVKPLITETFPFEKAVTAFEHASRRNPRSIKTQIVLS
jgi:D-xylulose reductase